MMIKRVGLACSLVFCVAVAAAGLAAQDSPKQANEAKQAKATDQKRVFEIRTYTAHPGKLSALHSRFRDHTMKLFEKHGMKNVAYWTPTDKKLADNTLVYVISHASEEAAKKSWKAFGQDPEWRQVYKDSIKEGKLVKKIDRQYLKPTGFSPMQK